MTSVEARPDGRRARGDATRRKAARAAARIATVNGLDSISVGGLASATGLSKSGILTVFPNREAIQVEAVAEARRIYREHIIGPAWQAEPGRPRLHALVDHWTTFLRSEEFFPGGCFIAATSVEFGHREGAVADAVRRLKREWIGLLETELAAAGASEPEDLTFAIDALMTAGNARHQLFGDAAEIDRAVRLIRALVDQR